MATVSATSIVFSPRGVPGKDDGEEGWEREKGREEKEEGRNGGRQSMSKGGRQDNEVYTMKGAKVSVTQQSDL